MSNLESRKLCALECRALSAFYGYGYGSGSMPPPDTRLKTVDGREYVDLKYDDVRVALYRIRYIKGVPMLKKINRIPKGIENV